MFSLLMKHEVSVVIGACDESFTGFVLRGDEDEDDDFLLLRFFLRLSVDMTRLLFSFRLFTSESMRFSADVAAACTVTMVTVDFVGCGWGCGATVVFC
jgi:hypothetical protein